MPRTKLTFSKAERLTGKKAIKELFADGSSFYLYPFKVLYKPQAPSDTHDRVLISVPRRIFKKVVDRNLLRRRMKEAYRLNKHLISSVGSHNFNIAYIYVARESLPYNEVENKLIATLIRLKDQKLKIDEIDKK